jgi:hypothetical protein
MSYQSLKCDRRLCRSQQHREVDKCKDSHTWPRSPAISFWQSCHKNIHSTSTTLSKITVVIDHLPKTLDHHPSLSALSKWFCGLCTALFLLRWPSSCPDTVPCICYCFCQSSSILLLCKCGEAQVNYKKLV